MPASSLTRDLLQQQLLKNDRQMHTRVSSELFFGMRDGGRTALDHAGDLSHPMLLLLGGADPIIDPDSGRAFLRRYGGPDTTLIDTPGMVHDPLFDLGREAIYRAVAEWIDARLSGGLARGQGESTTAGRSAGV